jgi:hypothetical protein
MHPLTTLSPHILFHNTHTTRTDAQTWPERDEETFRRAKAALQTLDMDTLAFSSDMLMHLALEIFLEVRTLCMALSLHVNAHHVHVRRGSDWLRLRVKACKCLRICALIPASSYRCTLPGNHRS